MQNCLDPQHCFTNIRLFSVPFILHLYETEAGGTTGDPNIYNLNINRITKIAKISCSTEQRLMNSSKLRKVPQKKKNSSVILFRRPSLTYLPDFAEGIL